MYCTRCHSDKPDSVFEPGFKRCTPCREWVREWTRERRRNNPELKEVERVQARRRREEKRYSVTETLKVVWNGCNQRCYNKNQSAYPNYGGRGIRVEFRDVDHFVSWAISSGYVPGLQIDRKNNNGNYSPDNCRWVTPTVNANNTRKNIHVNAFGETKTVAEWSRDQRCVVGYRCLLQRIKAGHDPEESITKESGKLK